MICPMEDRSLWFGLIWLWFVNQSFKLELDVEVSAERKAHCVGQGEDERQCVLNCSNFLEHEWMCRLFCSARCPTVIYLKWLWLSVLVLTKLSGE